jgi:uncharacterized iron-regulated protein
LLGKISAPHCDLRLSVRLGDDAHHIVAVRLVCDISDPAVDASRSDDLPLFTNVDSRFRRGDLAARTGFDLYERECEWPGGFIVSDDVNLAGDLTPGQAVAYRRHEVRRDYVVALPLQIFHGQPLPELSQRQMRRANFGAAKFFEKIQHEHKFLKSKLSGYTPLSLTDQEENPKPETNTMTTNRNRTALLNFLLAAIVLSSFAVIARAQQSPHMNSGYIPHRVYNSGDKRFSDFEVLLAELAKVDVAFVGEQHDDPVTHRIERAILEGLARRRANVIVSLEMFERDVQASLDDYLAGRLSEEEFLKASRPWPRYATDYRPLVEFARAHRWKVIASNVPRRIASQVSKQGLDVARSGSESDRKLVAAELACPMDDYFKRFAEVMSKGHPGADSKPADKQKEDEQRAMIERFYYAQCVKDETMAESIANVFAGQEEVQNRPLVVHFNGAFHSDYRLGTASRAARRLPKSKIKVISIVPVENLDNINVDEYRKRGDYIVFTLKPPAAKQAQSN